MSDDLNNKIKQIADILGQENIPDNVKGLLSALGNQVSNNTEPDTSKSDENVQTRRNETDESLDMVRKVKYVMDRLNSNTNPRINLLKAIRPFLNQSRQKKVHNCIKFLHLSSLTRLMDDQEKGLF